MKKKYYFIVILIVALIVYVSLSVMKKQSHCLSIFSWDSTELTMREINIMKKYLKELNVKTIYQNIDGFTNEEIEKFVKELKDNDISIYSLAGEPSWYEEDGKVIKYIERINDYNKSVENKHRIEGVVLDIEPWIANKEWDRAVYSKTMEKVYKYSKELNIKIVTVIPTWFDPSDLEIIIKNCDKVAVMNYNIDFPTENIKEEIYIAKKFNKSIDIIAEIQPINEEYGVEENTTYYYEGHDVLLNDWNKIKEVYKYNKIGFCYHDYKNIKEFINLEE